MKKEYNMKTSENEEEIAEKRPIDTTGLGLHTKVLHAGFNPDSVTGACALPIYQTNAYLFPSAEVAAARFELTDPGYLYTRLGNPTTGVLEERVRAIEGGVGAVAFSSGMAAITAAILTFTSPGDEIISARTLYGGTYELFHYTLPKFGRTTVFVDTNNPDAFLEAIHDRTKAIFVESIGNPSLDVPDFSRIAEIAHQAGIPLIVDNTVGAGLVAPIQFGADIVIHSATKYIGGHGNSMGGIIVDAGTAPWTNGKFPEMCNPDPGYHGMVYPERFGDAAYIVKARVHILRDTGACIAPFNAFMIATGCETLPLRVEKHCSNALAIAMFLEKHPAVASVSYPGLSSHPSHEMAKKYLGTLGVRGFGGIVGVRLRGGYDACKQLVENTRIFCHLANIGDAKSLITHPASTTHLPLSSEERADCGVFDDFVRLSVGIEDVDDLMKDLSQAFWKIK
jgi:O-acetylhomoserine (thiol)-lyase